MYTTAPMGMVQAVQPPAQAPAAYVPQAPVAARLTPAAVLGMMPAANPQPQTKQPSPQNTLRTAAQIQAANPRTAESYAWDVELEAVTREPAPTPSPSTTPRDANIRLLGGRESAITTQILVQSGLATDRLPKDADINMLIARAVENRAQQAPQQAQPATPAPNMIAVRQGQPVIQAPMLPSLAPSQVALMPSGGSVYSEFNTIQRRDQSGSVIGRGQAAYKQAVERLGMFVPPAEEMPVEAIQKTGT